MHRQRLFLSLLAYTVQYPTVSVVAVTENNLEQSVTKSIHLPDIYFLIDFILGVVSSFMALIDLVKTELLMEIRSVSYLQSVQRGPTQD